MTRRAIVLALPLLMAVGGCRNPFDPPADVKLIRFFCQDTDSLFAIIEQTLANGYIAVASKQRTRAELANYSTVPGEITSYSVVYRQLTAQPAPVNLPPGSPIPSLGGAAGRRFYIHDYIGALTDNTSGQGYSVTTVRPKIINPELLSYIYTNSSTIGGGIDCEVVFFGTDENGHEIKISGVVHVEVD